MTDGVSITDPAELSSACIAGACLTMLHLLIPTAALAQGEEAPPDQPVAETREIDYDEDRDDTADIDTESTVDTVTLLGGVSFSGDLRPLYNHVDLHDRDGSSFSDDSGVARWRMKAAYAFSPGVQVGARVAGRCTTEDCGLDWVMDRATPGQDGLLGGQFTFDELYIHLLKVRRFNVTVGRQQTRFVLRGGVFARSLDRNDSNNTNVTWTDGLHARFRFLEHWQSHFIVQRNAADGTGSIRRGPLDFDSSSARQTYFLGFENTNAFGPITQRSLDVSYLPKSLLNDGTTTGPREDYWTIVGRLSARWPQRTDGPRLRAGVEIGYAPNKPSPAAVNLASDVDGLAWNVVLSLMDFRSAHSIGVNYGRTGSGWFLSPQFRPNEEQFEIRYQWRPGWLPRSPLLEMRIRWRENIHQEVGVAQKREVFDGFFRVTWRFAN